MSSAPQMEETGRYRKILYLIFFALIAYLVINTGIVSDDILYTSNYRNEEIRNLLVPFGGWTTTPVEIFTHVIWYHFFRFDDSALINIIKILYIILSFYFITKFFRIYLKTLDAFLVSFSFLFFPSHDSTIYWFLGQYFTLCIAIYFYAYYLASNNRYIPALAAATIASFICYGSPVIAVSLSLIFMLHGNIKKAITILIPNVIYCAYYLFVTKIMHSGIDRIPAGFNIYAIAKQFLLQVLSFIDATLGPSMWMKIYYSMGALSVASVAIGVLGTVVLYMVYRNDKRMPDRTVMAGFILLAVLSFAMFSVTSGYYPQIAFNMGNRTTMFGSLLIVYLIALLPMPRLLRIALFSVLLFSALGISDHWKDWYSHQQKVIENIRKNRQFDTVKDEVVYVSGNQYSHLGKLCHIEFFSEQTVVGPLFKFLLKRKYQTKPMNKRQRYENGYMIDTKYGIITETGDHINVYDSEKDSLIRIERDDINKYINTLPHDDRHWIQVVDIKFIKDLILKITPRLKYALGSS